MANTTSLEYRVAYLREGREWPRYRIFQTRAAARRLVRKLENDDGRFGRITELRIEARQVGPWIGDGDG